MLSESENWQSPYKGCSIGLKALKLKNSIDSVNKIRSIRICIVSQIRGGLIRRRSKDNVYLILTLISMPLRSWALICTVLLIFVALP